MAEHDELPARQRAWSMAVIWVGLAMSVLDTSIANVALPTLAGELHATPSESIWVINAYQLGMVMVLLPLAAFSERLGYQRIYLMGMSAFSLASLVCVFAPNLLVLALGRGLQGVGAAGIMGMNAGLLRRILPLRMMGKGLGANATVIGAMTAAAPTIASAILSLGSWRWLFAVNMPFCAFALVAGAVMLPKIEAQPRRFEWISALLSGGMFCALLVGADLITRNANLPLGAVLLALAAASAVVLVRGAWSQTAPLFPVDLLRIPMFGLSVATSTTSFCAQMIGAVSMPFLFQQGLHRSVLQTGLLLTPWPVATAFASMAAGYLADRLPGALLNSIGLVVMAAGLILMAALPADADNLGIIWRTAICGAGFGFFQSPNNRTMVLATPRARGGATGGSIATARVTGQALGAVLVSLLFRLLPIGEAGRLALGFAGGLSLAAAAVSGLRLRHSLPTDQPRAGEVEAEAAAEG